MVGTVDQHRNERIHYSRVSDVLYFLFSERKDGEDHLEEAMPGVNVDYDDQGNVIGFEVLNASKVLKEFIQKSTSSVLVR